MCHTVEAASGKTGLQKKLVGIKTCLVALIANGLSPLRLWRSWWSGPTLDALRDGPLDKHGVGSRILDATANVNAAELARLAEFGKDCAGSARRNRTRPDRQRNRHLHEREFRTRRGPPAPDRPQADEWRMAGAAGHHGQGRGRGALPQRGRGQDTVRAAASARTDQCAAGVAAKTLAGVNRIGQGGKSGFGRRHTVAAAAGRDRRISQPGREDHSAARAISCRLPCRSSRRSKRPIGSTRTGRSRTGTGSTMRARAPRPSRSPTLVCRAGTVRASSVHAARPARGPQLSRTLRLHPKSEIRHGRRRDPEAFWLCEYPRRQDRAGAGVRCRPEADAGG